MAGAVAFPREWPSPRADAPNQMESAPRNMNFPTPDQIPRQQQRQQQQQHQHQQQHEQQEPLTQKPPPPETYELDDAEVDQLIRVYQDEMINHSPFVLLPQNTRACDLKVEKKLLYKAIIMATSFDHPARQTYYGRQVLEYIVEHLLMKNEKNIELLQGILLFTAW